MELIVPDEDNGEGGDGHWSNEDVESNNGVDEEDDGDSSTESDGERERERESVQLHGVFLGQAVIERIRISRSPRPTIFSSKEGSRFWILSSHGDEPLRYQTEHLCSLRRHEKRRSHHQEKKNKKKGKEFKIKRVKW
ncbi:hypothetical protein NE237_028880 [Protea cynaroides]|uniref:Uncharacterized protein n=1 Tax=Protea cynaroides TaxID=273540 RepID=A0A9Q0GQT2_9MAGN|nr:hypothetical protein NE237_028880 [Protea cynaroides]